MHPLIAEQHAAGDRADVKASHVDVATLRIRADAQWQRNNMDEIAERQDAPELAQRFSCWKVALQRA